MKTVPTDLVNHLAGGVTTLCHCWKAERRDGVTVGFTDHDRPIAFGGTTYDPAAGLAASEATAGPGLAVAGGEVDGALALWVALPRTICAPAFGTMRGWRSGWINWEALGQRLHVATGHIGEVETARRRVPGRAAQPSPQGSTSRAAASSPAIATPISATNAAASISAMRPSRAPAR